MDPAIGDTVPNLSSSSWRSQRGYDRLAPVYQATEWLVFGKQLQRAREALLDELPPWDRLLILGDGNGRLLARLCIQGLNPVNQSSAQNGSVSITSVDHSSAMLKQQRLRMGSQGAADCVEFIQADAREFIPVPGAYDVVVTPFFLDCFTATELEINLPHWLSALRPGGLLYHVDFIVPRRGRQQLRAAVLLWAMHVFFRWQTGLVNRRLVAIQPLLEHCGMRKVAERVGGHGMLAAQLWQCTQPPKNSHQLSPSTPT